MDVRGFAHRLTGHLWTLWPSLRGIVRPLRAPDSEPWSTSTSSDRGALTLRVVFSDPDLFAFRGIRNAEGELQAVSLSITDRLVLIEARRPAVPRPSVRGATALRYRMG